MGKNFKIKIRYEGEHAYGTGYRFDIIEFKYVFFKDSFKRNIINYGVYKV